MTWPPEVNTWQFELMKSAFSAGVTVVGLLLTWFVGQRLTSRWTLWQKEREMELSTVRDFYHLYGDFITLLRSWSRVRKAMIAPDFERSRIALFERAATAEGKLEAIIVKVAVERRLSKHEIRYLGLFRQAYQGMREAIRDSRRMDEAWGGDAYTIFKQLASEIACMLQRTPTRPRPAEAQQNLIEITSYTSADLRYAIQNGWVGSATHRSRRFNAFGISTADRDDDDPRSVAAICTADDDDDDPRFRGAVQSPPVEVMPAMMGIGGDGGEASAGARASDPAGDPLGAKDHPGSTHPQEA